MVFSGNFALYPRCAMHCGFRSPETSFRANAKTAIRCQYYFCLCQLGALTLRKLGSWTEQRLLNQLTQFSRQPLKDRRYSNDHVFE